MNTHPYLRAYLAGVFIPTLILPFLLTAFIVVRFAMQAPFPFERGLVFPLALVPALWGLWNVLWLGTHDRIHQPLGLHGALLPFLLMPAGATIASCLGLLTLGVSSATWFNAITIPYAWVAVFFVGALAGYYLVWKYVVGFLNRVLAIA
ncbi:MAG TPA: hypothetical protein VME23_01500 [Terracidiphilus sp.]|nr:hypothetical protein [Terracidiphilus sp.]